MRWSTDGQRLTPPSSPTSSAAEATPMNSAQPNPRGPGHRTPSRRDVDQNEPGIVLLAEIAAIAGSARTTRVLDLWVDPEAAFTGLLSSERTAAWLDAGSGAATGWSHLCQTGPSGYTVLGAAATGGVVVEHLASGRVGAASGSILEALGRVPLPVDPGADGFELGWVGWIGYESGAVELGLDVTAASEPDSAMVFVDRVISFDHARRRIVLRTFTGPGASDWLAATEDALRGMRPSSSLDATPSTVPAPAAAAPAVLRHSADSYRAMVVECQAQIAEGEAYQLCLTNQISVAVRADPVTVYRRLRRLNPTPRGGLIVVGDLALASSSPELFLHVRGDGYVETRPIKGTRPRGADPRSDELLRRQLVESEKERAENVMIVDLMRNDLSRVAQLGSVEVPQLFAVEPYANVFQLVSTVSARLAPGFDALSAVRAAFPAGSMTGAPKVSAMGILAGLESGPRGAYAGAFGYLGIGGSAQLSMTIRTVMLDRASGVATIGTGGGITALSQPDEEVAEMILKAQPVLTALGARLG